MALAPHLMLTELEKVVYDGIVEGLTYDQIAASSSMSVHTVKNYARALLMATGFNTTRQMAIEHWKRLREGD